MKKLLTVFTCFLLLQLTVWSCKSTSKTGQTTSPVWPYTAQATTAILYTFNQNYPSENETRRPETSIMHNGVLNPQATETGPITAADAQTICQIMSQSSNIVAMGLSKCFIPRHGIVWYNPNGEPIAHLSVCFECDRIDAVPAIHYSRTYNTQTIWKEKDIAKAEADIAAVKQVLARYTSVNR